MTTWYAAQSPPQIPVILGADSELDNPKSRD